VAALDLGWALILAGESKEAVSPLEQTVVLAPRHEQWIVAADARCLLGAVSLLAGDLAGTEAWLEEALELARTHGFEDLPQVGMYHATVGALHARRGELELADHKLRLGLEQMQGEWDSLAIADALLERALVRKALGARTEARAMLAQARAIIESCPDPGIISQRAEQVARKLSPARANANSVLTERELEVLRLLAAGLTEQQVAATLYVAYSTVHSHTKSIYRKLDAGSREKALNQAEESGLLGPG
jgi:LuxR family maltose regulon positive regulatory protein